MDWPFSPDQFVLWTSDSGFDFFLPYCLVLLHPHHSWINLESQWIQNKGKVFKQFVNFLYLDWAFFRRKLYLILLFLTPLVTADLSKYLCTGYSFWDRLRNFLHKFTWIVLSVQKLNKLGKYVYVFSVQKSLQYFCCYFGKLILHKFIPTLTDL